MATATLATHEERVARYTYLDAIGVALAALAGNSMSILTLDGSPLHDLPGEPQYVDDLQQYFDFLLTEHPDFKGLWEGVDEDEPEHAGLYQQAELLAGRRLLRLASGSQFCAEAAELLLIGKKVRDRA